MRARQGEDGEEPKEERPGASEEAAAAAASSKPKGPDYVEVLLVLHRNGKLLGFHRDRPTKANHAKALAEQPEGAAAASPAGASVSKARPGREGAAA